MPKVLVFLQLNDKDDILYVILSKPNYTRTNTSVAELELKYHRHTTTHETTTTTTTTM